MKSLQSNSITQSDAAERNQRILKFLNNHRTAVLATVDYKGRPRASVIYYGVDSSFTVRFLTKRGTGKSTDISQNPIAQLVVFDEKIQTLAKLDGQIQEITNSAESHGVFRQALRSSLRTSQTGLPPITKLNAGEYVAYALKPTKVSLANYSRHLGGPAEQIFELADLSTMV